MTNPTNPVISSASVMRRESYKEWKARRDAEEARKIAKAQVEAHRVMDMLDALRPAGAFNEVRAVKIEEQTQPMDVVIEDIRMKPAPHFVDPHTIRLANRLSICFGLMTAFLAGLAVGAAL